MLVFLGWRTVVFCYSLDFPENFELVVSRCRDAEIVDVSPDGEHIVVIVKIPQSKYWLINNITKEWLLLPELSKIGYDFVTDELMLFENNDDFYLWDLSSQEAHLLEPLDITPDQKDEDERLATMGKFFYMERADRVIVFSADEEDHSSKRYIIIDSQQPRGFFDDVEKFLIGNDVEYLVVYSSFENCRPYPLPLNACASHNDVYIARDRLILAKEGSQILSLQESGFPDNPSMSLGSWAGWTHDDAGLFFEFGHTYVFRNAGFLWVPGFISIPGGVGILKLP